MHASILAWRTAYAGHFSVHRFYNDLRGEGMAVSKDALQAMLGHLEDAFLVRLVPLATTSERQRTMALVERSLREHPAANGAGSLLERGEPGAFWRDD
jgi:hypothetical protein